MKSSPEASSWLGHPTPTHSSDQGDHPSEFERLWRGFMTARVTLGLVLVLLQGSIYVLAQPQSGVPLLICGAYFGVAMAVRFMTQAQQLGRTFDAHWLRTVGIDVLTFAALQMWQNSTINYAPLFALPVLVASILGSMMLAMGAAAGITLLLFVYAGWLSLQTHADFGANFLQAALTGAGCFAISFIASQLSTRLASVELRAQRNQLAATVQRQVNELVIETLSDGILVVDERGMVRSANPAAHLLLGTPSHEQGSDLNLSTHPGWQSLFEVISNSFSTQSPQQSDIHIQHTSYGTRQLWVRTQLTTPLQNDAMGLCVVFMQDQRDVQARIRAEKLSSMGRMSAAVAHEIRNPLAAITQANALLAEDLTDPGQQRLARMVQQNAQRLENIVHDVLHLAHAPASGKVDSAQMLDLTQAVSRICRDWKNQNGVADELQVDMQKQLPHIWFDTEHLRRILINLLDNAYRYASRQAACIRVSADVLQGAVPRPMMVILRIWSDGAPLEPSVEQHLFEPFFSSESRSSGLGLYICRELCENHGATMAYDRTERSVSDQTVSGNEFSVIFKTQPINESLPTAPSQMPS